jgi:hypothetical protein
MIFTAVPYHLPLRGEHDQLLETGDREFGPGRWHL